MRERVREGTVDTMTNGQLAGHSVLVTGGSSGIGLGIARKMAEEGAAVGINYRPHQEPAEKLAAEIRAWGGKAVAIGADVAKELDVHRLFEETVSALGRMDVLVANSGLQKDTAVADTTLYDWRTAEVWRRGSLISSWLLDLSAAALAKDNMLGGYSGKVADSGQGRWTIDAAMEEAVPAYVLSAALFARYRSRVDTTFGDKLLSAMRYGFGGHVETPQ
jgi:NAD(P)-dependent dehydrogenase (short-subunit alcohol dehydrogenase family)